jgi:hypothetical protein
MNTTSLLESLATRGILLSTEGATLYAEPARILTDSDRAAIRANKAEIIALVKLRDLKSGSANAEGDLPERTRHIYLNRRLALLEVKLGGDIALGKEFRDVSYELSDARDFLEIALASGPRESKELEAEAKQQGIGRNALFNAKKMLNIRAQKEAASAGRWFWIAPENVTVTDGMEEGEA